MKTSLRGDNRNRHLLIPAATSGARVTTAKDVIAGVQETEEAIDWLKFVSGGGGAR